MSLDLNLPKMIKVATPNPYNSPILQNSAWQKEETPGEIKKTHGKKTLSKEASFKSINSGKSDLRWDFLCLRSFDRILSASRHTWPTERGRRTVLCRIQRSSGLTHSAPISTINDKCENFFTAFIADCYYIVFY